MKKFKKDKKRMKKSSKKDQQQEQEQESPSVLGKERARYPLRNLGIIAATAAFPVVGCVEGLAVFQPLISDVGLMLTAYEDPFVGSYAECKRQKTEAGYKCMAPVFPKVSVHRDYQYWTAALKDYIDQCLSRHRPYRKPRYLVIQRCRGSEALHTYEVWTGLMGLGGFADLFKSEEYKFITIKPVSCKKEKEGDNSKDVGDDGLTLMMWEVYRTICEYDTNLVCTIFFRGGWEPDRIYKLPKVCEDDREHTTVFMFGTCCRFLNCGEGDVLVPTHTMRYNTKNATLTTGSVTASGVNYFEQHKCRIWSERNMRDAAKVILYGMSRNWVQICGKAPTFYPALDWKYVKPAIQIRFTEVFEAPKGNALEEATFVKCSSVFDLFSETEEDEEEDEKDD